MSTNDNPRREHPSTYYVQDRGNVEEMTRLYIQDQMITVGMGGVLPEQPDPTIFKFVLDVGCGTGGWLVEAARTYPSMSLLVGVDVSSKMVEYARVCAEREEVSDRVSFVVNDALRRLEFKTGFFDLVNQRFAASWLRTWEWPKLLQEFRRITRPGGVIRLTESDIFLESSSPALTRLQELALLAFYRAGHYFTPDANGITSQLERLMKQHGFRNVQAYRRTLHFRAGTPEGQNFYENMRIAFKQIGPFLQKWLRIPDGYEEIYQQALVEMQQPGFVVPWRVLTVCGNPSTRNI